MGIEIVLLKIGSALGSKHSEFLFSPLGDQPTAYIRAICDLRVAHLQTCVV